MLKKNSLILLCALWAVSSVVCMDVTLPSRAQESEDHSTITTKDGQEFRVPDRLLRLSETLRNLMEDVILDTVHNAIPLPTITGKTWQFIQSQLERLYDLNPEAEKNIETDLKKLTSSDLIEVIITLNYLDVPNFLRLAMGVAKGKDIQEYTFEQLNTLPREIRNPIIVVQLIRMLGPVPGKQLAIWGGNAGDIYSVCVTHDNRIISGSQDGTVRVWDMRGNQLAICEGHTNCINSVCVTNDNNIVSGSEDGTVRVWDIETGKQLAAYYGHINTVWSVCVTHDNRIVSGSEDGTVLVWDMEDKQDVIFNFHAACARSVCVTPDDKTVFGSWDHTVRVWDMQGNQHAQCDGHTDWVNSVCVTHTSHEASKGMAHDNKIVSASKDSTVRVWDMKGNQLAQCDGHQNSVSCVCVTHDNKIASGSRDGTVRMWDIEGNPLAICTGHEAVVWAVCVTHDNKIVSGADDGTMRVWDIGLLTGLQNMNEKQAQGIWAFLQAELLPMLTTGYVKINSKNCWVRIKTIMQAHDIKIVHNDEKVGGSESVLKRHKKDE